VAIHSTHCPVLGAPVSRVTDLEGEVTRIICSQYDDQTGLCRLKRSARQLGPLSQLLERYAENTLESRTLRCELGPAVF
jgi:hypothetical protein